MVASRKAMILQAFILCFICHGVANSFLMVPPSRTRTTAVVTHAKPPPSASFDLEAIEAFEAQLDKIAENEQLDNADILSNEQDIKDDDAQVFIIPSNFHNQRIDAVLAELLTDVSRSICGNLVTNNHVIDTTTGKLLNRKSIKLHENQSIRVTLPNAIFGNNDNVQIEAQNIPLEILYEDEYMLVLNKAAHMVVHPAPGNWDGTVMNALAYYLQNISPFGNSELQLQNAAGMVDTDDDDDHEDDDISDDNISDDDISDDDSDDDIDDEKYTDSMSSARPGLVHRLDKGTTGVLVIGKTALAVQKLSEQFARRKTKKTYLAVVVGNPGKDVTIDKPIGRHPLHRQRMRVVPSPTRNSPYHVANLMRNDETSTARTGRRALSHVDTLAFDGKLSVVKVRIETGRMHQIRVHLQDRRTPIYGDDVYGLKSWNKTLKKQYQVERPLLHAYELRLQHPITGDDMVFCAPLPDDMRQIAKTICPVENEDTEELFAIL